ncbi:competence protein ComGF [Metabacillus malikii]|uniref:Competence protein ComGF n=2 Tax=Metabacillus malikii TaxID=1504265 RepID=A0ABT9ZK94_9BACI|nr:competence protein ComGF [Metabacillus malikii]
MLNMLFSFFVYSIIISSLTLIFHFVLTQSHYSNDLKPFEWELFLIQLHRETKDALDVEVNADELIFYNKEGERVSVHQYGQLVRRQVNGKGHEIYLLNVKKLSFMKVKNGVDVSVVSENNDKYHHTLFYYKDLTK